MSCFASLSTGDSDCWLPMDHWPLILTDRCRQSTPTGFYGFVGFKIAIRFDEVEQIYSEQNEDFHLHSR